MEPIYCSIANRKLFSDYGFNMMIKNDIPSGGYIEVIFPSQYRQYLGIPLYAQCNRRCARTINSVVFYFDSGLVAGSSRLVLTQRHTSKSTISSTQTPKEVLVTSRFGQEKEAIPSTKTSFSELSVWDSTPTS